MRMWMVNPEFLCNRHLLGEHVECHMFVGVLNRGKSVKGYIKKGLLEIHNLEDRHAELAHEMSKRGMIHKSPLQEFKFEVVESGSVDCIENLQELIRRCSACRRRINGNLIRPKIEPKISLDYSTE